MGIISLDRENVDDDEYCGYREKAFTNIIYDF